jgi:hypothetical protein
MFLPETANMRIQRLRMMLDHGNFDESGVAMTLPPVNFPFNVAAVDVRTGLNSRLHIAHMTRMDLRESPMSHR